MKIAKLLIAALALFVCTNLVTAQSAKLVAKAEQKVEKMNAHITSEDASLALTDEQRAQVQELEIEKIKQMRELRKTEGLSDEQTKEQKKAINKTYRKQLRKVLSEAQREAEKAGRKKAKGH